jgi:flagellar biosynthesis/type III secretory pathway M-ring protein FliF/YscJ
VNDFLAQMRAFYDRLEPARRRVLWAAVVAALLIVVGVGVWAGQTEYVVLTRASSVDEAAAVTRSLAVAGIPYEIDGDGLTVRVPAPVEIDARRAASSEDGIVGL